MKKNNKGFTLVELLAVIVIMGILMMVAIPSVTRTIENSRKDTFVDIAKSYGNAARTLWTSDNLTCNGTVSSAVDDGDYYILINSKEGAKETLPVLVDQGGKSSWGNRDVNGYVRVNVSTTPGVDNNGDGTFEIEPKRVTKFYVALSDGTHGLVDDDTLMMDELKRGNVVMTLTSEQLKKVEFTLDDGKLNCSRDASGKYSCTNITPIKNMTGICVDDNTTVSTVQPEVIEESFRFGSKYIRSYIRSGVDGNTLPSEITVYEDGSAVAIQSGVPGNYPAGTFQVVDKKLLIAGMTEEFIISNDGTRVYFYQESTLIAEWILESAMQVSFKFGEHYAVTFINEEILANQSSDMFIPDYVIINQDGSGLLGTFMDESRNETIPTGELLISSDNVIIDESNNERLTLRVYNNGNDVDYVLVDLVSGESLVLLKFTRFASFDSRTSTVSYSKNTKYLQYDRNDGEEFWVWFDNNGEFSARASWMIDEDNPAGINLGPNKYHIVNNTVFGIGDNGQVTMMALGQFSNDGSTFYMFNFWDVGRPVAYTFKRER